MKPYEIIKEQMDFLFNTAKRMETKQLHLIECERCGHSFSENLIKHYDTTFGESDYCDSCAAYLDAMYDDEVPAPWPKTHRSWNAKLIPAYLQELARSGVYFESRIIN